jgi:hypothetical protein
MNMETGTTKLAPERDLYGKLIGVIKSRYQLKPLCDSLNALGIREIEVLDGPTGVMKLEKWKEGVSGYFFGDMEGEMLRRYVLAVRNSQIVFAAVVDSGAANDAAESAKINEATEVTHFGQFVITNY